MTNTQTRTRTGVLTFHRCINYGSYWQARCLVEGLNARGHDAVLLDHHSSRVNRAEWKCALRPTLPTPVPRTDTPLYREKMQKFFAAFDALPLSPCFPLEDPAQMPDYDVVVVGSDEVWNLHHPWYGAEPLFWGEGLRAKRLSSYAASCGNYPAENGLPPEWANRLRRFDAISIRDENARHLVQNALGQEPELVLDPCLQFPPEPPKVWLRAGRPYVVVYGHNCTPEFRRQVRRWADARGLALLSIGYRNDWADEQWLTAGPHEFADCIAQAQAVATNFFHGCVFALNNTKSFVCETSSYRSIKVQNLLALLGGENHLVTADTSEAAFDALLDRPLESALCERIHLLRQQSETYLQKADI